MEVIRTHIVYKKQLISGMFIKVLETSDGKYFREIGSGDAYSALYDQISTSKFLEMCDRYNKKVR